MQTLFACYRDHVTIFTTSISLGKGRGQHTAIKSKEDQGTPRNLSCDWLTQFMKDILLGLSLVRTILLYGCTHCTGTGLQIEKPIVCKSEQLIIMTKFVFLCTALRKYMY